MVIFCTHKVIAKPEKKYEHRLTPDFFTIGFEKERARGAPD